MTGERMRVLSRLDMAGDCWPWTMSCTTAGYGQVRIEQRHHYVHRYVWELLVGPIPAGMQLDHLCRVRACANPDHLEVVTSAENNRRGFPYRQRKMRCRKDLHDLVEGRKGCLPCKTKRDRERRWERGVKPRRFKCPRP